MSSTEVVTVSRSLRRKFQSKAKVSPALIVQRPAGWGLCISLLLAIAIARIVLTYHVFSHTIDEPSHIACGIEWWEKGVYRIEPKHTPLARIAVALGPYLAGVRGTGATNWRDTYPILSANGHYWRNLTLGRLGVLPFFVLASMVVFLWTRRLFGVSTGLIAIAIFTFTPAILAHSGVATTDLPFTAMFCWALYAFTRWLGKPSWRTAALFGVAAGLALSTKLSTLLFLPTCAAAILTLYVAGGQRNWPAILRTLAVALLCAFFVTWAVYRFSHAPLSQITKLPERAAAKVFGKSSGMAGAIHRVTSRVPVPAPELFDGIRALRQENREGTRSFLFGHVKVGGWWYFFFVAVALKSQLAVLLLAALGSWVLARRYLLDRTLWESMVPLSAALIVMIVTIPSRVNLGVRHVLPMFAFLSILAAVGLTILWTQRDRRLIWRTASVLLCVWLVISSLRSHPDYLTYFNEFGGRDPSRLLVISDFDWGQDLARLATYLRERGIKHVSIAYDGWYVPDALGLPATEIITTRCDAQPSGWVAMQVRRVRAHPECYPWLARQHLVSTVGKTMWIYHMEP